MLARVIGGENFYPIAGEWISISLVGLLEVGGGTLVYGSEHLWFF